MCTLDLRVLTLWLLMTAMLVVASVVASPNLGRPVSAHDIESWEIGVMPSGEGLPSGSGTAVPGEALYRQHCESCHGLEGRGASADELAGGRMSLTSEWPDKNIGTYWPYATTVFDFTRRSMPLTAPGSLSDDEVYALTAYLLYLNGIIGRDEVMNAQSLPKVMMPNRDGFIRIYPE